MSEDLLKKVGLDRPELRAWAMYDWANSAMATTIIASVFPIYYSSVACHDLPKEAATGRFAYLTSASLLLAAIISPFLGAFADFSSLKKRLLGIFAFLGALATAAMFFIQQGDWLLASVLFLVANVGVTGSFVFYDSLLPHIAHEKQIDRVSAAGYALGYLGGGIHLVLALIFIQKPEWFGITDPTLPVRIVFVSVAIWWLLFSIPLFLKVPEPARRFEADEHPAANSWKIAWVRLGETFRSLRQYKQAALMLLAFLLYNDGIGTIIRMATSYGNELGLKQESLIQAIVLVQFIGFPCSFLFGLLAGKIGQKPTIYLCLGIYCAISVFACFMQTETHFFILAVFVGIVQGGSQAISRSLFASMVPKHKSAEFFGFFGVMDKFAGILGPALFAITNTITGSSRGAIVSVLVFFIAGGIVLSFVNPQEGQRAARDSDSAL